MIPDDASQMRVLVVAPHADDETLGCGGTIARLARRGARVRVLILTHRAQLRRRGDDYVDLVAEVTEARGACRELGVGDIAFAGFGARELKAHRQELIDLLEKERDTFRPTLVFVPDARDTHHDHQAAHEAVTVVWRPHLAALHGATVLSYQAPSSFGFTPTVFLPVGPDDIEAKQAALLHYSTELEPWPHTRSAKFLEVQAEYWGGLSQLGRAEVFDHVVSVMPAAAPLALTKTA